VSSQTLPGVQFLDPAVLARIGNLELVARTVVEGFLGGLHRSPHLGTSIDFAEHRQYMPGDDIRRIDLERRGILRRGRGKVREEILETPPPRLPKRVSGVALLLEERENGR